MSGNNTTISKMYKYRWSLFFLSVAVILAIPALLIISSPLLDAAGFKELASAGSNMSGSSGGQQGAMGSTAGAGAAGAAAAGSSSGSGKGRGKGSSSSGDDNVSPQTPLTPPKSSGSDDDESSSGFGRKSTGSGKQPGQYDPNSSGKGSSSSSGSSSSGGDDSGFFPQWLTDLVTGKWF